jgi:hypothetical protein
MKRFWIVLLIAAIAIVIAVPVSAAPPCSEKPNHPKCIPDDSGELPPQDAPLSGTVCDPAEYPDGIVGIQTDDFSFTLSGKNDGTCIDVISDQGPWEVTITGTGARFLGVIPRDSIAPGDSCGGYQLRGGSDIYGSNPLILGYNGEIPAATINACGTDFGEWVNKDLPGLNPDIDCAVIEGAECLVAKQIKVTQPLILQAFLSGTADGETTISVDLPPLDPN